MVLWLLFSSLVAIGRILMFLLHFWCAEVVECPCAKRVRDGVGSDIPVAYVTPLFENFYKLPPKQNENYTNYPRTKWNYTNYLHKQKVYAYRDPLSTDRDFKCVESSFGFICPFFGLSFQLQLSSISLQLHCLIYFRLRLSSLKLVARLGRVLGGV